jgi:hypothetical protein
VSGAASIFVEMNDNNAASETAVQGRRGRSRTYVRMVDPESSLSGSARGREQREQPLGRQPPDEPLRVRPGDRPQWVEPGLSTEQVQWLRHRADELSIGVDVLVALAVEWKLLSLDLHETYFADHEPTGEDPAALAPTPALRRWMTQLATPQEPQAQDSLPQLLLPERLLARWRPTTSAVIEAVRDMPGGLVLELERHASTAGLTMSEWGYRQAWRFLANRLSV